MLGEAMAKTRVGTKVVARFSRDESGAWLVDFPSITGAHTYGRSLRAARRRVPDVLKLFDVDPEQVDVVEEFALEPPAREAIHDLEASREELRLAIERSQRELDRTLTELRGRLKLSTRDAADLIGISHQRVAQLLQTSRAGRIRSSGTSRSRPKAKPQIS